MDHDKAKPVIPLAEIIDRLIRLPEMGSLDHKVRMELALLASALSKLEIYGHPERKEVRSLADAIDRLNRIIINATLGDETRSALAALSAFLSKLIGDTHEKK